MNYTFLYSINPVDDDLERCVVGVFGALFDFGAVVLVAVFEDEGLFVGIVIETISVKINTIIIKDFILKIIDSINGNSYGR